MSRPYSHRRWAVCPQCSHMALYRVAGKPGERLREQPCFKCGTRLGRGSSARAQRFIGRRVGRRVRQSTLDMEPTPNGVDVQLPALMQRLDRLLAVLEGEKAEKH